MKKVLKQCYLLFGKDYQFLKLIFTIFASYLIIKELYSYLVLKPTYTSDTKRSLKAEDFPEILLCPQPPIDVNAAKSRGYFDIQGYFVGVGMGIFGWSGNTSENVKQVSDEISTLKSEEDCPYDDGTHFIYYSQRDDVSVGIGNINFTLTKALYPFHICCKIIVPQVEDPILYLHIIFAREKKSFKTFRVFMSNKITSSYFNLHKTMLGDHIISSDNGLMNYKIKILEDIKLDDDPNYPCINYGTPGEYSQCLEKEILKQNYKYINCTPPWMTDDQGLWCQGEFYYDSPLARLRYTGFLHLIGISDADPGRCLGINTFQIFLGQRTDTHHLNLLYI